MVGTRLPFRHPPSLNLYGKSIFGGAGFEPTRLVKSHTASTDKIESKSKLNTIQEPKLLLVLNMMFTLL
jgi:hypothetical protein